MMDPNGAREWSISTAVIWMARKKWGAWGAGVYLVVLQLDTMWWIRWILVCLGIDTGADDVLRGSWGIDVNLRFETSLISAGWTPLELVLAGCKRQTSRGFGPC